MPEKKALWLRTYGAIRDATDRALHRWRQSRSLSMLAARSVQSVYFVCEGNIYRSPFAEAVFLKALPNGVRNLIRVGSGGFVGPYRPSPAAALAAAESFGVDLRQHRSALLSESLHHEWDLIVVMEPKQRRALTRLGLPKAHILVLGDLDHNFTDHRAIIDPWQQDTAVLHASYTRIDRCVRALAKTLTQGREEDRLLSQAEA
jgi:protein-tyrosine-phosphatase